ncbi:MAG: four helix bundle protein [Candidatus Moranbacteria bacterium]|nr:four helix bundle protein [Candidatus Moranbacteria bacterium]
MLLILPRIPPPRLLPVLQKLKETYILWFDYYRILPKTHRYSLGKRIDDLFAASIEAVSQAGFLSREKKLPYVQYAIRKVDTIKVFLMILWETKSLDDNKYLALSLRLDEIGRMLGGWSGQITKQNSPEKRSGEK